jgi:hypothetical protein
MRSGTMSITWSVMAVCPVLFAAAAFAAEETGATTPASEEAVLQQEFDLAGPRTVERRHYRMETKLLYYAEG